MKKNSLVILCAVFLIFVSYKGQAESTVISIYNHQTDAFDDVDIMTLNADDAGRYLPNSETVRALFQAYIDKGEPISLALLSTLSDVNKAKASVQHENGMLEIHNFKLMKNEVVDINRLDKNTAKDYIPQSEALFKLFDFYAEEHSVQFALHKTLIDANNVLGK